MVAQVNINKFNQYATLMPENLFPVLWIHEN